MDKVRVEKFFIEGSTNLASKTIGYFQLQSKEEACLIYAFSERQDKVAFLTQHGHLYIFAIQEATYPENKKQEELKEGDSQNMDLQNESKMTTEAKEYFFQPTTQQENPLGPTQPALKTGMNHT